MHRLPISIAEVWLERYTALLVILGGLTLILAATLHPFNFAPVKDITWQLMVDRLDLQIFRSDSWVDIPRNILLFIPFGLGISALLHTLGVSTWARVMIVALTGLGTTLAVEGLQFLLQLRSPELSDVLANTCGMLVSSLIHQIWLMSHLRRVIARHNGMQARAVMTLLLIVALVTLLPFGLTGEAQGESYLANWDSRYRLAIGNELSGDRPWRGRVDEVVVMDRGATPAELETFLQDSRLPTETPENTVTHYCIACDNGLRDLTGFSPELVRRTSLDEFEQDGPFVADPFSWLETATSVTTLSERIAATSEFSILVVIHPAEADQSGPARILTLSKDAYNRNFTMGQEGDELVVRLRTLGTGDNGLRPEFRISGIFDDHSPRRIAVTYSSSWLRVYVDRVDNSFSARLAPEIAVVSKLIPINNWHVAMSASSLAVYSVIYYLLLVELVLPIGLIPLAWATGLLSVGRRPSSHIAK